MKTKFKSVTAEIKAIGEEGGLEEGEFTAYASVFGNKDSYGDVVVKGAFADCLVTLGERGHKLPSYWSHLMAADPMMNIGEVIDASEDDHGLLVKIALDIVDNPKAAYAHKLLKSGRVRQMSFAYDVIDAAMAHSETLGDYYELRKLWIHEVSVVPIGANQETEVLTVKAAVESLTRDMKAGRAISAKNEGALRAALENLDFTREAITDVLAALEPEKSGKPRNEDEGRTPVKSSEVASSPDYWALQLLATTLEGETV